MKSKREYEDLFEDLMEFTNFKSSDEITTQEDLKKFFDQVENDAKKKGRKFRTSRNLFNSMAQTLSVTKQAIQRKLKRVLESKKAFKDFKTAKKFNETAVVNGKRIFKTVSVSFFDEKGKRISNKIIRAKLKELRVKEPDRFVIITQQPKKGKVKS